MGKYIISTRLFWRNPTVVIGRKFNPVTPLPKVLRQTALRNLTDQALKLLYSTPVNELLPLQVIRIKSAWKKRWAFAPPTTEYLIWTVGTGQSSGTIKTGIYEELLAHNLAMQKSRVETKRLSAKYWLKIGSFTATFLAQLRFSTDSCPTKSGCRYTKI